MRLVKRSYIRNRRLILGNGKNTSKIGKVNIRNRENSKGRICRIYSSRISTDDN